MHRAAQALSLKPFRRRTRPQPFRISTRLVVPAGADGRPGASAKALPVTAAPFDWRSGVQAPDSRTGSLQKQTTGGRECLRYDGIRHVPLTPSGSQASSRLGMPTPETPASSPLHFPWNRLPALDMTRMHGMGAMTEQDRTIIRLMPREPQIFVARTGEAGNHRLQPDYPHNRRSQTPDASSPTDPGSMSERGSSPNRQTPNTVLGYLNLFRRHFPAINPSCGRSSAGHRRAADLPIRFCAGSPSGTWVEAGCGISRAKRSNAFHVGNRRSCGISIPRRTGTSRCPVPVLERHEKSLGLE